MEWNITIWVKIKLRNIVLKMKKILKTSACILACVGCCGSLMGQSVQRVTPDESNGFGIVYSLPKTAVEVTVTATCVKTKKGRYADYAERYLDLKSVPKQDAVEWSLDHVEMQTVALPDTARCYKIAFGTALPIAFYLNEQGILQGINREPVTPTEVAAIVASAAEEQKKPIVVNVMSEELMKAGSESKQAEIAARQIYRIRQARLNLITGEVDNLPADGASFQLVLDNLEAQEKAYLALFEGEKEVTQEVRTYHFESQDAVEGEVLFRFSRHLGFVDADDLSGKPFAISMQVLEDNRRQEKTETPPVVEDKKKRSSKSAAVELGIAYLIPGKAVVSCLLDGKVLESVECRMGQFGRVEHLPAAKFSNKKAPAAATLNAETGAITLYDQP